MQYRPLGFFTTDPRAIRPPITYSSSYTFDLAPIAYPENKRPVRLSGQPLKLSQGRVSTIMVKVARGTDPFDVVVQIMDRIPGVIPLESPGFFQTQRNHLTALLRTMVVFLGGAWVLSLVLVGLVFASAVNEREREIGVLRALGSTQRHVLQTVLTEGVLLGLVGGLAGVVLASFGLLVFQQQAQRLIGLEFSIPSPIWFFGLIVGGLALALLTVLAAASLPAWRISKREPAIAMRG